MKMKVKVVQCISVRLPIKHCINTYIHGYNILTVNETVVLEKHSQNNSWLYAIMDNCTR